MAQFFLSREDAELILDTLQDFLCCCKPENETRRRDLRDGYAWHGQGDTAEGVSANKQQLAPGWRGTDPQVARDTWEPVLHNPGSWLWQGSRQVLPVSQFKLWWLLSSVRDSQGRRLDEGHPPRAGQPQTVPGLESQKLLASGIRSSNREPGCLTTLLKQTACGFLSSQGLLVREAGG